MDSQTEKLVSILKALADESRISLIRLLNQQEYTVGDLAEHLSLTEPTISHHLSRLRLAGLVTLRAAGNQRFYHIHPDGLDHFRQLAANIEQTPFEPVPIVSNDQWIDQLGWPDEDCKVLKKYIEEGKITHLPNKQKKMQVILRWLSTLFRPDYSYTEAEVNQILRNVYEEDFISLRRDLIDMGYLRRERGGGKYWLISAESESENNKK